MATMYASELRVDPYDGNPYTHDSFLETYSDGEEKWNQASIWKSDDGILRIRTAPLAEEATPTSQEKPSTSPAPQFCEDDFPSIGTQRTSPPPSGASDANHYSRVLTPEEQRNSLSPDADDFKPGATKHILNYSVENCSSNEEFETLPSKLWDGDECFPQPMTDESTDRVDWENMIHSWTPEQWREFGVKYFYGYIQQSTILMGQIPYTEYDEESNIGSWGDA